MAADFVSPERALIVDDHALVRDGLRTVFEQAFPACEVLDAADLAEALDRLESSGRDIGEQGGDVDLVLLDLLIPGIEGLSGLETLRGRFPTAPVVIVSGVSDPQAVRSALAAGAAGFVPKSLRRDQLVEALRLVLAGGIYRPELLAGDPYAAEDASIRARIDSLTPQQRVVLGQLAAGKLNKQIAYELDVSMTTVKAHVSAILQKMHVFSRTQAVILANRIDFRG
ncbi:LuxR family two component transcriptional regulator [Novosphingobium sp. PhB165]|uniref:response regulator transcription factor n=1 Tax=Novosphingobium sp. PhB165 TaxID=2485105 RepID=UPI001051BE2F|nr:response regulator transcription factor [Novosphingobium sp. PhB165]TCM19808.1 LuxR family two component transcriptional regulator [Novosphingobium sp. PhB165]